MADSGRPGMPLSRERIEEAALALIERDGLDAFSMRSLGRELNCQAMSLYHYFPSKGHVMDALVDRIMGSEMTVLEPNARDWRQRLEASAREWRALAHRRPHFFGYLAMHRLNTPNALRWLNGITGVFTSAGAGGEAGVRMFRILGYYLVGALLDETAGYSSGHSTVEPVPDEVMNAEFPYVVSAGQWYRPEEWEGTFERGLKVLLDGFERMVDMRAAGA